jgi:predicted ribosomally synthesized peptide with SipW-like signal peptide
MSNNGLDITRRKILGTVGAVGVASAGAGLGTTAFFSDTESFNNNSLTAGELDLKVDWEEHYFGGRDENGSSEATLVSGDPNPADVDYYLPAPDNPDADPIALNFTDDQDALWDATAIEAFPDGDDDGLRDGGVSCDTLLSVDNALDSDKRTSGNGQGNDDGPDPLIQLGDVKPGDFGEVTFSFHLCDNPGYVWMQGELIEAAENGVTEPEADDEDEEDGVVELLDEARARAWYDDGDNQIEQGPFDVMVIADESISQEDDDKQALVDGLNEFASGLPSDTQAGLLTFGDGSVGDVFQSLGDFDPSVITTNGGGGNTPLPPALDIADQELDANARDEAGKVIVAFTDGGPNYGNDSGDGDNYSAGGYTAPRSSFPEYDGGGGGQDADNRPGGISDSELVECADVARRVRDSGTRIITVDVEIPDGSTDPNVDTGAYLRNEIASSQAHAKDVQLDDLAAVANDLAAVTMEEDLFFEGTLRETLNALSSGNGIPLDGDQSTPLNEFDGGTPDIDGDGDDEFPDDAATNSRRECFAGDGATHYVGFEWWLPVDHANQIQTDRVEFDVGFYTEQCRHNDGATS